MIYFKIRNRITLVLLVAGITGCALVRGQSPLQLYISNDDHTDYMWAGNESQYTAGFISMLDYYIAQSNKTSSLPSPYQSRFNCDGTYWLWEYKKHKTPAEFNQLIEKIKSGHISVPYNALVSCYGANNTEGVLRGMYYAGHLERKFGLKLDQAVAMENQTLPLGLGSLWAGTGVKYSWKGVCNCASKLNDLTERDKEIYWYKGIDNSRVLMKWYSVRPGDGGNKQLGGYAEARDPSLAVEQLNELCQSSQYPYHIAGAFGFGWDDLHSATDIFTRTAQEKTSPQRQVTVSNQSDFFKAFEKAYGDVIPDESLAYGNEWDLYSASMAAVSGKVKRSVEKLRAAEAMASLVVARDKTFDSNLGELRKTAWMALGLYYEHNWTADGPISRGDRANWQRKIESQLSAYVDSLYTLARQKLGSQIRQPDRNKRFYAFNPLSWRRTDVCDFPYSGSLDARVVDVGTNLEVPSQVIQDNGRKYLRILASDIPSLGYKVYEVKHGKRKLLPDAATFTDHVFENTYFKLYLTSEGVITSFVDKRNGNFECVAPVNGRFMNDLGSGPRNTGTIKVVNAGPVSVTVVCVTNEPLAHTSSITLFRSIPRVDIHNQITQNFSDVQRWAFSYNIPEADVWHEEIGAILNAKPVNEGGHYAARNSRFDWLTLNHFADITNGKYGIMLSNADCAFMKRGNSALTNLDTQTAQLSVLAGGQVDGENLGILKQGGDSLFIQRFALGTHKDFEAASAMRFSLEHQNPLVGGQATGKENIYPEQAYSFLTISDPNVLIWSLKPAEDGAEKGLIARVWNFSNKDTDVHLSFDTDITSAHQTTHVETDLQDAKVVSGDLHEPIGHHQLKTFRILLNSAD